MLILLNVFIPHFTFVRKESGKYFTFSYQKMSEKYTTTKRCYLIDHHSPQPPDVLLNHLDIHEYEAFFDTANIDSLMVYCKDHWGVTYYPSNVPGSQQHKGVQKDWIQ